LSGPMLALAFFSVHGSIQLCQYNNSDCSGGPQGDCKIVTPAELNLCAPATPDEDDVPVGGAAMMKCKGTTFSMSNHATKDCSDDVSKDCQVAISEMMGGLGRRLLEGSEDAGPSFQQIARRHLQSGATPACSYTFEFDKCTTMMELDMGMLGKMGVYGTAKRLDGYSCGGGEDEPCFSREAEACRILDTAATPSAAFRACFDEAAVATVAQRVKMIDLVGGDYVLSSGKELAYEFTRVIVNQHKLNEKRSSIVKITHTDGEIELTPDHVLLVDGQWAAARTVKVGSSLSGSSVTAISHGFAGVINPVTVSGMIVAAGATGRPVVSSAYPEWIAEYMLESNNGYYPLPISMANLLSYLFPVTAQAYWDEVLEHAFAANQQRLGSWKLSLPTALVAPIIFVLDLLCSAGLVLFALANAKVLAALTAVAVVARARRVAKA